jgi:hypothetical protein
MLKSSSASTSERLSKGFELAASRRPVELELAALEKLLQDEHDHYTSHRAEAEALIESADDFVDVSVADPVELATWTSVARAILNLYETVTRN